MDEEEEIKEGEEPTSLPKDDLESEIDGDLESEDLLFTDDDGGYNSDDRFS